MASDRFGRMLRDLRLEKYGSLAKMADATGIPAVVIGSYERGDRRPTIQRYNEILALFDLELGVTRKQPEGDQPSNDDPVTF